MLKILLQTGPINGGSSKQIDWYTQNGKTWEKEIRQLLALDIKKKTAYQSGTKLVREYEGKRYEALILDEGFIYEGI